MAELTEATLSVPDISCDSCVSTVNRTLGKMEGVTDVNTDLATKTVHFRYNPGQVSLDTIEANLDDVGYTVAK